MDKIESEKCSLLEVELFYSSQWDEFWSYVGSKKAPYWTWYLIEKQTGIIIAWQNGRRQDEVLQKLVACIKHIPIRICHTDEWGAYRRCFPCEYIQRIGKDNTWKIERKNLNFRTHIKRLTRKTICFSKNQKIHDKVISMYIEKYYYKTGTYAKVA